MKRLIVNVLGILMSSVAFAGQVIIQYPDEHEAEVMAAFYAKDAKTLESNVQEYFNGLIIDRVSVQESKTVKDAKREEIRIWVYSAPAEEVI